MSRLHLIAFALRQLSAYGQWKAGADMFGGEFRKRCVAAHLRLRDEAADALMHDRDRR